MQKKKVNDELLKWVIELKSENRRLNALLNERDRFLNRIKDELSRKRDKQ